jgi:hypothetical protein
MWDCCFDERESLGGWGFAEKCGVMDTRKRERKRDCFFCVCVCVASSIKTEI